MTGWQHRYSKKNLETGNIWFNSEYHQIGKKKVLGKEYKKFQTPENWLIQVAKIADLNWPPSPDLMDKYELGQKPFGSHREPERLLRNIGHHPYRAKQPNGWSDHSADWISPELLIRRLVYAKASYNFAKMENNKNADYYVCLLYTSPSPRDR